MQTWSNHQTDRDIRAAQRNNARSYEDLRVEAENAAYDAYYAAEQHVRKLTNDEVTEVEIAEAKAEALARKKEWRNLVHSH